MILMVFLVKVFFRLYKIRKEIKNRIFSSNYEKKIFKLMKKYELKIEIIKDFFNISQFLIVKNLPLMIYYVIFYDNF